MIPYGEQNNRSYTRVERTRNGSVVSYVDTSYWTKDTYRNPKSSQAPHPIDGSGTMWIDSSSYSVIRTDATHKPGHICDGNSCQDGVVVDLAASITYGNMPNDLFGGHWAGPRLGLVANDANRAQTEALLKLKDQKVDLGTNLAQARQTALQFADLGMRGLKSLRAVKQGNFRKAMAELWGHRGSASGTVARNWLEWTYGWKPLADDIYGTWELLNQQLPKAMIVHARRNVKGDPHRGKVSGIRYEGGFWRLLHSAEHTTNFTTSCVLHAKVNDAWSHAVAQSGIANPAAIAWEIVPYSFVVDWALPIGSVLSALDATSGLSFLGGTTSIHAKSKGRIWVEDDYFFGSNPEISYTREGYTRQLLSGFPAPIPYWKSPLSTGHTLNALALLRQLF